MNLSNLLSSSDVTSVQGSSSTSAFSLPGHSSASLVSMNQQRFPNHPGIPAMTAPHQILSNVAPSFQQMKPGGTQPTIMATGMNRQAKLDAPASKKPKLENSSFAGASGFEEGSDDEDGRPRAGNKQSTEAKRSQHCEVEKRRRERMNRYMSELAQMIPACTAVPRRLDKLSILKMAVDHMKNLRGDPHAASDYKPGFLTDEELKQLVVEAANGFMLIIECSQAKVLFVSDTISEVLNEEPENWIGSCLYDSLHPKDIQKVKEQLTCFDIDDAKKASSSSKQGVASSALIVHSQTMNGLRRSFLCRVKKSCSPKVALSSSESPATDVDCNNSENVIKLLQSTQQRIPHQYAVLYCTGFIRNLTGAEKQALHVEESSTGACLVAVARLQHFGDNVQRPKLDTSENMFVARIGVDGRFTYVDPRVAGVLGYLPQDLIGQISYEYYHPEDIQKMVHLHHDAMKRRTPMPTVQYRFLTKNQKWLWLAMKAFSFINPFSQQVEYVVCTNVIMTRADGSSEECGESVEGSGAQSGNGSLLKSSPGETPHDVDKQERIERYVRMTIQNHAESRLAQSNADMQNDSSYSLVPSSSSVSSTRQVQTSDSTSAEVRRTSDSALQPLSTPAMTTIEENAAAVQRILEDYNKMHTAPSHRRDMNYQFPEGLFNTEVNLEGSQEAYRNILTELENPADFASLFDQIEAAPTRPNNMFPDVNMDIFD